MATREELRTLALVLIQWAIFEAERREVARREWAKIDGVVLPPGSVVYHRPGDVPAFGKL